MLRLYRGTLDQVNACVGNVLPLLCPFILSPLLVFELCGQANSRYPLPRFSFLLITALGSGILFTYPEIATIAGVQGLVVYGLASALPLLVFGYLGPIIRRKCPEGFVLTEWARQRYGIVAGIYLSILTYVFRSHSQSCLI